MSTEILVQGTPEWREARATKITGSRVAAIIGASPFTTEAQVMREMVRESLGEFEDISNVAMRWGTDHEDTALELYKFLFAGGDEVTKSGFHVVGNLGASPDALVGETGLVEIKCPYGLRDDVNPAFKSIDDLQHYWHQMQMQMYCLDKQWCHFFQWTPHGYSKEVVHRDPRWYKTNEDVLVRFYERYEKALADADVGGPAEKLGMSIKWQTAAEQLITAEKVLKAAKTDADDAKKRLTEMLVEADVELCVGSGLKAMQVVRKGSIDYKLLAEDQMVESTLKSCEEDYRRSGSVSWKFSEEGQ